MFKAPIAISLSPNTQADDVSLAFITLFQPWIWKKGKEIKKVEDWFRQYFQAEDAVSFQSGRSALLAILDTFGIGKGDEVIIQAFTCVAVADPIIWKDAKPVYADIDETLNIDPNTLKRYITSKTKVIIVQHTFGVPADILSIKKIAQKHNILLIEDCAHSLGANIGSQKIGTFGDAAFFSFGRDKVISSVFGGMAVINSQPKADPPLAEKLREFQEKLSYPSYFWILQQLLHPIVFTLILPIYNLYIGKLLLVILQKLKLLSFPVEKIEKFGGKPDIYPSKYPNAPAKLLLNQLNKLEKYNRLRRNIADYYFDRLKTYSDMILPKRHDGAIYLRFNLMSRKAREIFIHAAIKKVLLGNWYHNVINPKGVDFDKLGYKKGMCPKAEEYAALSVNLPTYPRLTETELNSVISIIE